MVKKAKHFLGGGGEVWAICSPQISRNYNDLENVVAAKWYDRSRRIIQKQSHMYTQIWQRTEVQLWNSGENTAFSINRTGKVGYQCKGKKTPSKLDSNFTLFSKLYSRWNSKCDEWNSETSGKQMNSVCVCVCVCSVASIMSDSWQPLGL